MLQQTQVDTVLPYFERFMSRFPSVDSLATAPQDEVLSMWSGLGYYSRARNMHKAAKLVAERGEFPLNIKGLRDLPGVGEYMAAAIASIALGQDEATVDGNIARVMARLHADAGPRSAMWGHARAHLPPGRAGDYNQALMDLGARICRPRRASCEVCPVRAHCAAYAQGTVHLYPPPKKKKKVPLRRIEAFSYVKEGAVLLVQRPAEGLWGGLWELPSVTSAAEEWRDGEAAERFQSIFGVPLVAGPVQTTCRHVLTHKVFEFRLSAGVGEPPLESSEHTGVRWVAPEDLNDIGLSALTAKAIRSIWS